MCTFIRISGKIPGDRIFDIGKNALPIFARYKVKLTGAIERGDENYFDLKSDKITNAPRMYIFGIKNRFLSGSKMDELVNALHIALKIEVYPV